MKSKGFKGDKAKSKSWTQKSIHKREAEPYVNSWKSKGTKSKGWESKGTKSKGHSWKGIKGYIKGRVVLIVQFAGEPPISSSLGIKKN